MEIKTKTIPVKSNGTPKFAQGKIEETDGKFTLSRKSGNTFGIEQTESWEKIGVFENLKDAIERSSKEDFFNRSIADTQKVWPEFPNGL